MHRVVRHYEIALTSSSGTIPASVTTTVLDWTADGRRHRPCTVAISWNSETVEETAQSVYHAFQQARAVLEERGLVALCQGSRPMVQVSGMLVDMGDGTSAYDLASAKAGERLRLVEIFDPATADAVASVAEQRDWARRYWVRRRVAPAS